MSTTNTTSQEVWMPQGSATSRPIAASADIRSIEPPIRSAHKSGSYSEGQIAKVAASIAAFGFIVPVLVYRKTIIIAEHGRIVIARKLK